MRYLDRNGYLTLEAYTGCCPDDEVAPTPVDPGVVFIAWANQLLESTLNNPFAFPVVTWSDDNGATWTYYYPDSVDTGALGPLPANVNAFEKLMLRLSLTIVHSNLLTSMN
jgi:hypothetical protein